MISIKNIQTENSAVGFLELDQFLGKEDEKDINCPLNYERGPAGKLLFSVKYESIKDYE